MTDRLKLSLAWMCAAVIAIVIAVAPISAAFVDGHYIPNGADSFYHARRILDAAANPGAFFQFDSRMHFPEGSLVIWPWTYDWVMSLLVRAGLALHLSGDPIAILDNLPVLAFALAPALMLIICRQLGLSVPATTLAMLATSCFPLNQTLYGVGDIDHHYAEHLFVLGSLAAGLAWLRRPDSALRAAIAGVTLGLAPGVHTALFILQLPLVCALGWLWIRNSLRPRTATTFAVALVLATCVVALPSLALRLGHFDFYTLSWFQVYFAACAGGVCVFLCRLPFSRRNLAVLAILIALTLIPVIGQMLFAERFFTVAVAGMDDISEVQSPWRMMLDPDGFSRVASYYTYLIYLTPAVVVLCCYRLWRETEPHRVLFWIASVLGIALLTQQLRLNYFGSFALYLPWILTLDAGLYRTPASVGIKPAIAWSLLATGCIVAWIPGLTHRLFLPSAAAGDRYYQVTRKIYPVFADECRRTPGVTLADPYDGHYIRYHTDCAVIANPFLLTPLHEQKLLETRRLMNLPAAQLLASAPYLRYVYVRRNSLFYRGPGNSTVIMPRGNPDDPDPPLVQELLTTATESFPPRFRLVKELFFPGNADAPYARLFAIDAPQAKGPS